MQNELKEKYGLFTAIAMVVGIVIGSGVFFKAEKMLNATGGNLPLGILAWALGGMVMIICAYTFSILATQKRGVGGLSDYAESTVGSSYAYFISWFTTFIYFPAMTSVLAWVSARYTGVLFGFTPNSAEVMVISLAFLVFSYALNTISPILSGKFQVSATIIKLIPLIIMAVVGSFVGLSNGMMVENFTTVTGDSNSMGIFSALVAAAFAYEGWIIATSINAEIKNSKKNLPIALITGTLIIAIIYILYYVGLAGCVSNAVLMENGEKGAKIAFQKLFGSVGGVGLFVLVIISCLGTLNGLMLANTRSMYTIAARKNGPRADLFGEISNSTNMPTNSSVLGLLVTVFWFLYFFGSSFAQKSWFGKFIFDSSELPIITIYAIYIPIFFMMMVKNKNLPFVKRFVFPALSILCSIFMVIASLFAHGIGVFYYLIVFFVVMLISIPFYKRK